MKEFKRSEPLKIPLVMCFFNPPVLMLTRWENYFFSDGRNVTLVSFLAFFAARFSFKDMTGFFMASLLLLRSFDMVILRIKVSCM